MRWHSWRSSSACCVCGRLHHAPGRRSVTRGWPAAHAMTAAHQRRPARTKAARNGGQDPSTRHWCHAHAGFPRSSYEHSAERVTSAGLSVAATDVSARPSLARISRRIGPIYRSGLSVTPLRPPTHASPAPKFPPNPLGTSGPSAFGHLPSRWALADNTPLHPPPPRSPIVVACRFFRRMTLTAAVVRTRRIGASGRSRQTVTMWCRPSPRIGRAHSPGASARACGRARERAQARPRPPQRIGHATLPR